MNIVLLSNEYPPNIYGGAGVHVDYLTQELVKLNRGTLNLRVFCFGDQKETVENMVVVGIPEAEDFPFQDPLHKKLLDSLYRNLSAENLHYAFVSAIDICVKKSENFI